MGDEGLEPLWKSKGNTAGSYSGGAESGAAEIREARIDSGLAIVVEAWRSLPESIKFGILAMLRSVE